MHAEEALGFQLNGHQGHQGRARCGVDEQIQIAFLGVISMNDRPEYTRTQSSVTGDDIPQLRSIGGECFGRLHDWLELKCYGFHGKAKGKYTKAQPGRPTHAYAQTRTPVSYLFE